LGIRRIIIGVPLKGTPDENRQKLLECAVELYDIYKRKGSKAYTKELIEDIENRYGMLFVAAVAKGIITGRITRKEVMHFKQTGELHGTH